MVRVVSEHVLQHVSHLSRRGEHSLVVAILEARTACAHEAIQSAGDGNEERTHSVGERATALAFDNEMEMIALHGVVHDAK